MSKEGGGGKGAEIELLVASARIFRSRSMGDAIVEGEEKATKANTN